MKLRNFFFTLAAGVMVLLLTTSGSLYWILAQSPLNLLKGGVYHTPTATIFVDRQAPVMVSLLVNPSRLEAFRQLAASPGQRRESQKEIQQLERNLLAKTGLDYHQDIQPWLGEEVTLAVNSLDFDRNSDNGTQPGYLLALNTKDAELAKEFLQLSYTQQAISGSFELIYEQYKGANLIYQRPLKPQTNISFNASAVVGNFVLFANHPQVLKDAINNAQAVDLNLENSLSYQNALATILNPRIGIAFVNIPALSAWIGNQSIAEKPEIRQMLTVTLGLQPQGLTAQTALIGVAGEKNQKPALSAPVGALNYVPGKAILTAAGSDLNQFWTNISTGLAFDSPLQQLLKQFLLRLQQPLGIDFATDIFPWVKGEYSLALLANPQTNQLDWLFVTEKVADVNSEEAIENLDKIAKEQGLNITKLPLEEREITAWTKLSTTAKKNLVSLDTQVKGTHLSLEKYEIFATSTEAISQALAGGEYALVNTDKFQQAIIALPSANDGYFYINWQEFEPLLEEKIPLIKVIELAAEPLFKHLRSLTLSSQGSENSIRRGIVFFNLV